jgi:uncharacterized protein (TIGR03083 family)
MTNEWGQLYRDHVEALEALGPTLTDDQLATVVPATPRWTVHEVLAHLAGGGSDAVTGRMDGAPSPEWSERHVAERRGRTVGELMTELRSNTEALVDSVADNPRPALVWDIAVHHADLHEALALPRMKEPLWTPVAEALAGRSPELAGSIPTYELFRASFSRRSRSQMQGWGTALSAEQLDEVCIFGPREDDQPVPA